MNFARIGVFLKTHWPVLVLLGILLPLLFTGLADNYLWEDESCTALFAKGILRTGWPHAWDGRNLAAARDGLLLNRDFINEVISPAQYYLAALSFGIFGVSTFSARLPFVLTGIAAVIALYFCLRTMFRTRQLVILSVVLLASSPSFLLYVRQARYYSLAILFTVLFFFAAQNLNPERRASIFWFVLVSAAFFYSQSLIFASAFSATILTQILVLRDPKKFKTFLLSALIAGVLILPYFAFAHPGKAGQLPWLGEQRMLNALFVFWWYLRDLNRYGFFPVIFLFALPLVLLVKKEGVWRLRQEFLSVVLFILIAIAVLSYLTPQDYRVTTDADMRYVVGLLPFLTFLTAACLLKIFRWRPYLGVMILVLTVFTNLPTLTGFRTYLFDYVGEITHDYTTNYEAASDFLRKNGSKDDTVFVDPDFHRGPLIFYLGDRFLFAGVIDENLAFKEDPRLPDYVKLGKVLPDWIVTFGKMPPNGKIARLMEKSNAKYRTIVIEIACEDYTRPEIMWHRFKPVSEISPQERIFLYQLSKAKAEPEPFVPGEKR